MRFALLVEIWISSDSFAAARFASAACRSRRLWS
jgi:hypothetical protein